MSSTMREDMKHLGYSSEEEYFYRLNRDLIERRRRELDQKRASRDSEYLDSLHWMRCPKCGSRMNEVVQTGIRFERCGGCEGVYFDRGELETLIQTEGDKRFLELAMKR